MSGTELALRENVALIDLTVPQLGEAAAGLDRLEHEYENMSGICAVMKGLVFSEVKRKLKHGEYRPWLKKNFPRSFKTAERYVRISGAFAKSDSAVAFQALTQSLADSFEVLRRQQLDLSHPIVAKVAQWVKGRGAYQLMLDFPASKGGDRSGSRKNLTSEQEHAEFLSCCKENFASAVMCLDELHDKKLWKATSITDAQREAAAELAREFAREVVAFNKLPKRERSALNQEDG